MLNEASEPVEIKKISINYDYILNSSCHLIIVIDSITIFENHIISWT